MTPRYVVLGLAPPRARWFVDVARWSTGAALPVEFVKCVTAQEVRVRVESGRRFSAAMLDAGARGVDRDLVVALREHGAAVFVVSDGREATDWAALGAAAVLPARPGRREVLDVLGAHASMVRGLEFDALQVVPDEGSVATERGRLVAVTGPAGVGASTTAIALAQGLADHGRVLLADLCLVAELGMLHDARDVAPALPELLEAHGLATPDANVLGDLTWRVEERAYDLLLGLRRSSDWTLVRRATLESSLRGLRRRWEVVVADVDPCVEGEEETGSVDVEDRHLLARTTLLHADQVVLVARPGLKWLHGAVRVLHDLVTLGVDPSRVLVVVIGVGRRPRLRAELTRTLAELAPREARQRLASPVFLPPRDAGSRLRDGTALPPALVGPLASAVVALLRSRDEAEDGWPGELRHTPERIEAGDLGGDAGRPSGRDAAPRDDEDAA